MLLALGAKVFVFFYLVTQVDKGYNTVDVDCTLFSKILTAIFFYPGLFDKIWLCYQARPAKREVVRRTGCYTGIEIAAENGRPKRNWQT